MGCTNSKSVTIPVTPRQPLQVRQTVMPAVRHAQQLPSEKEIDYFTHPDYERIPIPYVHIIDVPSNVSGTKCFSSVVCETRGGFGCLYLANDQNHSEKLHTYVKWLKKKVPQNSGQSAHNSKNTNQIINIQVYECSEDVYTPKPIEPTVYETFLDSLLVVPVLKLFYNELSQANATIEKYFTEEIQGMNAVQKVFGQADYNHSVYTAHFNDTSYIAAKITLADSINIILKRNNQPDKSYSTKELMLTFYHRCQDNMYDIPKNTVDFHRFSRDISHQLQTLHENSYVHRDIKPGNIMNRMIHFKHKETGDEVQVEKYIMIDYGSVRNIRTDNVKENGILITSGMTRDYLHPLLDKYLVLDDNDAVTITYWIAELNKKNTSLKTLLNTVNKVLLYLYGEFANKQHTLNSFDFIKTDRYALGISMLEMLLDEKFTKKNKPQAIAANIVENLSYDLSKLVFKAGGRRIKYESRSKADLMILCQKKMMVVKTSLRKAELIQLLRKKKRV